MKEPGKINDNLEFLGTFASELGELARTVTLQDKCTVGDLIEHLAETLGKGDRFKSMVLDENGNKQPFVLLMLNYKLLYRDPFKVTIPDKAKVVFAMPSAGG